MRLKFWVMIIWICLVIAFFGTMPVARGGTCSSISRTNASANSVLTSSKYNSDLNTVYTAANDLDAGCLTDGTLELGALNSSDFDVLLNSMQVGCKVSKSDAATLSVGKCRLAVDGTLVKTTSATTVTWGCTSCASESSGTEYYLYATTSSTASSLDLLISTTAPDEDGYNGTSRVLGKFYNNSSGDIQKCGISQWKINGFEHSCRNWQSFSMTIKGSNSDPTKANSPANDDAFFKRVDDEMVITYTYHHTSSAGSAAGSGLYVFRLPSGYSTDTTKILGSENSSTGVDGRGVVGPAYANSGVGGVGFVRISTETGVGDGLVIVDDPEDANTLKAVGAGHQAINSGTVFYSFTANVPIEGWGLD